MTNQKLKEALEKLNLSELAQKIYLSLLSNPNLNVSELSILLGKYRAKIYETLIELEKIRLIEKQEPYNKKIIVKSPNFVLSLIKQKQFEINKLSSGLELELPYILNNLEKSSEKKSVKSFYGINEFGYLLATILDDCNNNDEMVSFNEHEGIYNIIDTNYFFNVWIEKRIKKNIHNKILANFNNKFVDKEKPLNSSKLREMRVLPDSYNTNSCYWVISNKIIFWDSVTPKAILIENKFIAELMVCNFTTIWNNCSQ